MNREAVWVLHHVAREGTDDEDVKFIGVYSSQQKAEEAAESLRVKPGFREHPDSFHIERYEIDVDHWVEGFVTERIVTE